MAVGLHAAGASTACRFHTSGSTMKLAHDCSTTTSIVVPAGDTLDGKRHSITAVDSVGDRFRGIFLNDAWDR